MARKLRIRVDHQTCVGNAMCETIAPKVFRLNDNRQSEAVDPDDPDSAFVIPLEADRDRVTPGGRVRVYETRDAGSSWTARGEGLPEAASEP